MTASDTPVKDVTPRNQYTASSNQTDFPYDFVIFDKDDLTVLKTTDPNTESETTTTLTEGSEYTVDGVGDEDGGKIVLSSGADSGDLYTLVRETSIERLTDFLQSGDYQSDDINLDLDTIYTILQEKQLDIEQAATLQDADELNSIELPTSTADEAIAFNESGDGLVSVPLTEKEFSKFVDGEKMFFGNDEDYSIRYSDSDDGLVFRDENNDADMFTVNRDNIELHDDFVDDNGNTIWDYTNGYIPEVSLENNTVTVAGNSVDLGSSTSIDHADLSTISSGDHHTKYTDEEAQDAAWTITSGGTDISVTYDDASDSVTIDITGLTQFDTDDLSEGSNKYYTEERVDDDVNNLLVGGTDISTTYDDAGNTLTINNTASANALDAYLQPDGLTISNNSTDSLQDIDVVGGKVAVHDFNDNWQLVNSPDETPAIAIDSTGEGGRINSSTLDTNAWYEIAVMYDSTSDTVGYGIYKDADRPTSASELPGDFDHIREMGKTKKFWWVLTDGNSDIYGFSHTKGGKIIFDPDVNFTSPFNDSSPTTGSAVTVDVSGQVPPVECDVRFSSVRIQGTTKGGQIGFSTKTLSIKYDSQTTRYVIENGNTSSPEYFTDSLKLSGVTGQEIYFYADSEIDDIFFRRVSSLEAS